MTHLVIPKIECVESRDSFARFLVEPLEKGLGITLGNSLRRVLLSGLSGAAVTNVRIEGVQHEFSIIPNVKEDVIEFLLNVRGLRLKPISAEAGKLTLEVEGARQVYAADIEPSANFEIANPELYLSTLDSPEAKLNVEFDVELGRGYKEAGFTDKLPIGVIPIDAIFSPIRKVNFTVEPVHMGQETGRERLYLEVWTDGTIVPAEAMSAAADILIEQLSPFVNYVRISQIKGERESAPISIAEELYNMPVDQMNLSVRTMNCLRRGAITTVGELISREEKELVSLRNLGKRSLQEIKEHLKIMELSLTGQETEETTEETDLGNET
ncbi:DNA-directed RNA polymerase subunit alpha [Chloroflexota bacterium]